MFAGNFAPAGWMFCEGQLLPISENETLFQLIGTTYGGDGQSTFGLPDLRGRLPLHQGNGFAFAETGGTESVTLTVPQIPAHNHPMLATNDIPTLPNPGNNVTGQAAAKFYRGEPDGVAQCRIGQCYRRKPAAQQLPAVSVRRLHHFALRDLSSPVGYRYTYFTLHLTGRTRYVFTFPIL